MPPHRLLSLPTTKPLNLHALGAAAEDTGTDNIQNIQINQPTTIFNHIVNFFSGVGRSGSSPLPSTNEGSSPIPSTDDLNNSDRVQMDAKIFKLAAEDIDNDKDLQDVELNRENASDVEDSCDVQSGRDEDSGGDNESVEDSRDVESGRDEEDSGGDNESDDENPNESKSDENVDDLMFGQVFMEEVRNSTGFDMAAHRFIMDEEYALYVARSGISGEDDFKNDLDDKGVFAAQDIRSGMRVEYVEGERIKSYQEFMNLSSNDYYFLVLNERLGFAILEYNPVKNPRYRSSKMAYAKKGTTVETNVEVRYDSDNNLEYATTYEVSRHQELVVAFDRSENQNKVEAHFSKLSKCALVTQVAQRSAPDSSQVSSKARTSLRRMSSSLASSNVHSIFPLTEVANQLIAGAELNYCRHIITYGINILESTPYSQMLKDIHAIKKHQYRNALYFIVYQISNLFDRDALRERLNGLDGSIVQSELKKMALVNKNKFKPLVQKVIVNKSYLSFCNHVVSNKALQEEEETDLEFRTIENMVRGTWKEMDELKWNNLASFGGGFGLYISIVTTARIINFIRKYFHNEICKFKYYVDIGVGCPYLIASLLTAIPHVSCAGLDFPDVVKAIKEKISFSSSKCSFLKKISFEGRDVLECDENLQRDLQKCQVITNLVGITRVDEYVIKNVLPRSSCRIIMFRSAKEFPKLHEEWLSSLGFKLRTINGTLHRSKEEKFYVRVYFQERYADDPEELLPELNPSLLVDKEGAIRTAILGNGREYKTLKFPESEKDFAIRINSLVAKVSHPRMLTLEQVKSGLLPLLKTNKRALAFVKKLMFNNFPDNGKGRLRKDAVGDSGKVGQKDGDDSEENEGEVLDGNDGKSASDESMKSNDCEEFDWLNDEKDSNAGREDPHDSIVSDAIISKKRPMKSAPGKSILAELSVSNDAGSSVVNSSSTQTHRMKETEFPVSDSNDSNAPADVKGGSVNPLASSQSQSHVVKEASTMSKNVTEISGSDGQDSNELAQLPLLKESSLLSSAEPSAFVTPPSSPAATNYRFIRATQIERVSVETEKLRLLLNGDYFATTPDLGVDVQSANELVDYLMNGDITFSVSIKCKPDGFKGEVCRGDGTCAYQLAYLLPILIRLKAKDWPDSWWLEKEGELSNFNGFLREKVLMLRQNSSVEFIEKIERVHQWKTNPRTKNRIIGLKDWANQDDFIQLIDTNVKTSLWWNSKNSPEWLTLSWKSWAEKSAIDTSDSFCTVKMKDFREVLETKIVGIVQDCSGVVGDGDQLRHFFPGVLPDISIEDIDYATSLLCENLAKVFSRDLEDLGEILYSDKSPLRRGSRKRVPTSNNTTPVHNRKVVKRNTPKNDNAKGTKRKAMKLGADQKKQKTYSTNPSPITPLRRPNDWQIQYHKLGIGEHEVRLLLRRKSVNDLIVDFRLMNLYYGDEAMHPLYNKETSKKVHIFSALFYKSYRGQSGNSMIYSEAKKFTGDVNIFTKQIIMIPIGYGMHWSLIAICNPGKVVGERVNDITGERDNMNSAIGQETSSTVDVLPPCILHLDSLSSSSIHNTNRICNAIKTFMDNEWASKFQKTVEPGYSVVKTFTSGLITIDCRGMVIFPTF